MKATVKKWGNSAAVRIPHKILEAVSFSLEEEVQIREDNGRIIIEPVQPAKYDLQNLLSRDFSASRNSKCCCKFIQNSGLELKNKDSRDPVGRHAMIDL
jgi:antitoxin MazE